MAIQAQLYSDNLGFQQDWIDNGCGGFQQFCLSNPQKMQLQSQQQQQQSLQLQQLQNQQSFGLNTFPASKNINTANINHSSIGMVEKQRNEIDEFIKLQGERLRFLLQEQRKQQAILLKKLESKAFILLRQKDEEICKATNKTMELENLLKKLEMENQAWQRVAQENEATIVYLNNRLEQLRAQSSCCFNADDAESCCDVNHERVEETEENRGFTEFVPDYRQEKDEERARKVTTSMVCKCCNSRSSCILFLPCRHLCSCKDCAAFLDSCPVCRTQKKACIEVLIP